MEQAGLIDHEAINRDALALFEKLHSSGYNIDHAASIAAAQISLMEGVLEMVRYIEEGGLPESKIDICVATNTLEIPLHDDHLAPSWIQFADALSSVPASEQGYIDICFNCLQLGVHVKDLLRQPIKAAPIKRLMFWRNGLGSEGLDFVADVVTANGNLEALTIIHNPIESKVSAHKLAKAVINHSNISELCLEECRLGQNDDVMVAIVPAFEGLEVVRIPDNFIGSHGVALISNCLARNPCVEVLDLENNVLDGEDAIVIASALKLNTKLKVLILKGNRITQIGINALSKAVANHSSMDALHSSNHTCLIDCDPILQWNVYEDPNSNKKRKVLNAIHKCYTSSQHPNIRLNINQLSLQLMPSVLALIQGDWKPKKKLEALFRLMREWSMPLLYTRCVGFEPYRSLRIRKRKIAQLMEHRGLLG